MKRHYHIKVTLLNNVHIASLEDFRNSRDAWNQLVLQMRRPSVFCTWEWIYTWWNCFGRSYDPLILFICEKGELVGIFPLALRKMRIEDAIIPARIISYCGSFELYSDHIDILHAEGKAEFCIEAVVDFLHKRYNAWDVLHLSHLPEDSNLIESLAGNEINFRKAIYKVSTAPYIAVSDTFGHDIDAYLKSLSRNKRHDLRRRQKLLFDKSGVSYSGLGPSGEEGAVKKLFFLHELRAKRKGIKTSFSGEELMHFHDSIMKIFFENGWLRFRFLTGPEGEIASLYCFSFANRVFAYQLGFDPEWEHKGVGAVILYSFIEEAFRDEVIEFDFLRGSEVYKDKWTRDKRNLFTVNIFNNTLRGFLFRITSSARSYFKTIVTSTGNHK